MTPKRRFTIFLIIGLTLVLAVGAWAIGRYRGQTVATPSPTPSQGYVALGDSVAAGMGLATYSDPSACDRTNESYPHAVASQLHYALTNIACSHATTSSGLLGPQDVNKLLVASQQTQLFALPQPKLISATIGANDMEWTTVLAKCYTASCGSVADTAAVTVKLAGMSTNLKAFLTSIQTHYDSTPPAVVVTGYHQIFPATKPADCTSLANLDTTEITWARAQQTRLNDAITLAVSGYAFAKFAPVDFTGHELCTAMPWVQDFQAKAPFHPTSDGEPAFATAVVKAANQLK